jgi:HPt (histidine-containing phosphotransfer) domain-containing protein
MRRALEKDDFDELGRLTHWLKGTGGTIGFAILSEQAAGLQQRIDQRSTHEIAAALEELESMAARIQVAPVEAG